MSSVQISGDLQAAYLVDHQVSVSLASGKNKMPTPTSPQVKPSSATRSGKVAIWGDNNLFPQEVVAACRKNTLVPSTLDWKARALYAGGLITGKTSYDDNGNEKFKPARDTDFEAFRRTSGLHLYLIEAIKDFYWFYHGFPELVLSADRKKINSLATQDAQFCRWEVQNEKTGLVENCYINANWENNENADSDLTTKVPVLDPYYDPVAFLQNGSDHKYIYPLSYPSSGKVYYQLADWHSIIESGWLGFANYLPEFKQALMKNQITVKYHIEIAEWYWEKKYGKEWATYPQPIKMQKMEEELKRFNDMMSGAKNAGKAIITMMQSDPKTGKEFPGWKITAIDDKLQSGAYIEDSQEASAHLLYALGVDGTLIGSAPGKNMGSGSGSDKREAFNMYLSMCQIHADIILSPLYLIRDYNGWDPELEFKFKQPFLQTLDKVSPKQRATTTE
jgi:hypothetical protein